MSGGRVPVERVSGERVSGAFVALSTLPLLPHIVGLSVHEIERIIGLFYENLGRYLAGDVLPGRVGPGLGTDPPKNEQTA